MQKKKKVRYKERLGRQVRINLQNKNKTNYLHRLAWIYIHLKYIQIEEGTEATTYEPYINNQKTVVIPKGSTGNRTYTANWIANN